MCGELRAFWIVISQTTSEGIPNWFSEDSEEKIRRLATTIWLFFL